MGDYMPDLSSLLSTTAMPSTAQAQSLASSVPSWQLDPTGTGGVPYTTATTPQNMSVFSAYAPSADQVWKQMNSPLGALLLGKLMNKPDAPPPPAPLPPRPPSPFVQPPLQLSGGFNPLKIPTGGGMGGDPYELLLSMLMRGRG
jgi:hypothetical protein